MDHTSYYESDERAKPMDTSRPMYDVLESNLRMHSRYHEAIYVLATHRVDGNYTKQIRRLEGVLITVPMGEYIDVLVAGDEEKAINLATTIQAMTGNPVGYLRYTESPFPQGRLEKKVGTATRMEPPQAA